MDSLKGLKQVTEWHKMAFDCTYNTIVAMQDQTEAAVNTVLDKTPGLPEYNRRSLENWTDLLKQGREQFKAGVDAYYESVGNLTANDA